MKQVLGLLFFYGAVVASVAIANRIPAIRSVMAGPMLAPTVKPV